MGRYTLVAFENVSMIERKLINNPTIEGIDPLLSGQDRIDAIAWEAKKRSHHPIPIKFPSPKKNDENEKKELFEIDIFTLQYKNLDELTKKLMKDHCIEHTLYTFKIQYSQDKEFKYRDIVLDNSLLRACADYCQELKEQGYKSAKIKLNTSKISDLDTYMDQFISYMSDSKASKIMEKKPSLIPYFIKKNLLRYRELISKSFRTPSENDDLDEIKRSTKFALSKYYDLRKTMIWEQLYQSGKLDYLNKIPSMPKISFSTPTVSFINSSSMEELDDSTFMDPDETVFLEPDELAMMSGGEENSIYRRR